jgi:hypothetical protein
MELTNILFSEKGLDWAILVLDVDFSSKEIGGVDQFNFSLSNELIEIVFVDTSNISGKLSSFSFVVANTIDTDFFTFWYTDRFWRPS